MKKLQVIVYSDREHVGKLSIVNNGVEEKSFEVAAMAHDIIIDALHPKTGKYQLLKLVDVPGDQTEAQDAYGSRIIYFIKKGSTAKEDVLIVHGGNLGGDGLLIATEGGLRVSNEDFAELAQLIEMDKITELTLEEKKLGFFKNFTTKRVSSSKPGMVTNYAQNYSHTTSHSITDNPFFWMWLYDEFSSHNSNSYHHGFAGFGGGSTSGGGAGGSFAPGVDDSQQVLSEEKLPIIVDPFEQKPNTEKETVAPVIIDQNDSYLGHKQSDEIISNNTSY
jgi:hypothetical protein